jgi:predicted transcriptional regulator
MNYDTIEELNIGKDSPSTERPMEHTAADALATALEELARGTARTRPISVSLPGPLLDALQSLAQDGRITSTSAAVTEALTRWIHNQLLRHCLQVWNFCAA